MIDLEFGGPIKGAEKDGCVREEANRLKAVAEARAQRRFCLSLSRTFSYSLFCNAYECAMQ